MCKFEHNHWTKFHTDRQFSNRFLGSLFFSRVLKTSICVENLHSICHDHSTIAIHSICKRVKRETTNKKISKLSKTLAKKVNKGEIKHDVYVNPLWIFPLCSLDRCSGHYFKSGFAAVVISNVMHQGLSFFGAGHPV